MYVILKDKIGPHVKPGISELEMSFIKYWKEVVGEYEQLPTCMFLLSLQLCQASLSLSFFKFLPPSL